MRETLGREVLRADIVAQKTDAPVYFEATAETLGKVTFTNWSVSSFHVTREGNLLKDGCDDIILSLCSSKLHMGTGCNTFDVEPGGAVMISAAREYWSLNTLPIHHTILRFPRSALAMLVPRLGEAPIMHLPRFTPGLNLLFNYARCAFSDATLTPDMSRKSEAYLLELIASLINPSHEEAAQSDPEQLADARFEAIKQSIRANLANPGFSLEGIARMHGLSLRQVQRLFARAGDHFSEFVRRERLVRAYTTLTDPGFARRQIISIALDSGFQDISTFNRAFKRLFGISPREAREHALAKHR
ncbi:AraC family transcriptional regulator [Marinobacterium zhoushanense]|uniref:AraC family transcriptional regulator n=1 Tax=Marinobacterium zhoushanense TaxID=1679163 RepID=A0ABQ1K8T4_9GAMM|nr:helix-turn-helix domain-containing protein [Marinobacterium zhoushanense]GGB86380.1 AraC family transcriptional regulator [Marinobacterium zhoushanense]